MTEIPRFSYSKINSYSRCEFAFDLSYNKGWKPERYNDSMSLGTLIHTYLDGYYNDRLGGIITEDEFLCRLNERSAKSLEDPSQSVTLISHAHRLVMRYIRDYALSADKDYRVLFTEKHVEAELKSRKGRPFILEGYIDLAFEHLKTSKVYLLDHKSYKAKKITPIELEMDPQMSIYNVLARENGYPVFKIFHNLLNTYDYKKFESEPFNKLFDRVPSYRTETELDNFLLELRIIVDRVLDHEGPYRRNLRRDCARCWYQKPCLVGLKGHDMEGFLQSSFKQKEKSDRTQERIAAGTESD